MYENLIGQIIDKTNKDFIDFPSTLEGEIYLGGDSIEGWSTKANLTPEQEIQQSNLVHNNSIYEQLEALDLKSVRPLREGNALRVAELEAEAELLRTKLL